MIRQTHTYVTLDVSPEFFHEVAVKLKAAGYNHAFSHDGREIDMHGIALVSADSDHKVIMPGDKE